MIAHRSYIEKQFIIQQKIASLLHRLKILVLRGRN